MLILCAIPVATPSSVQPQKDSGVINIRIVEHSRYLDKLPVLILPSLARSPSQWKPVVRNNRNRKATWISIHPKENTPQKTPCNCLANCVCSQAFISHKTKGIPKDALKSQILDIS
ncbi:uncharacterized protein BO95DRAFT_62072 [Aspergillus brunneoviolaceus CBS 621.78]|uniref:Uncharacterized protein n=1 Tax=Aspergillus brunneoviolaceus CBS 621.78 TaxID=1450534 RepID=A0ACD1GGD2_9EURO|nr:hypothetical protein BO95DRAFT_62072 [Aspergillus brunneoviolaceus CBS 621.78]RAH48287.1 hypothetical protein BO95DRAFT_62072 [Aspergillus brunneoviolaceus CBS 621.78]